MTDLRQAAQQALEALKGVLDDNPKVLEASISGGLYEVVQCRDAITALKAALEQQQAEPVAQRKPLTDEEIQKIWDVASGGLPGWSRHITFARAIEAKLKERNHD